MIAFATMQAMGAKVAFLPLGVRGDLVKHPELRPAIVERLKMAGAKAEKAGVVIGIETSLPAKEEVRLLADIGSPAIRSYFNFANALQAGRDLLAELRTLGRERICQIHCTDEDGVLLEHNQRLDLPTVKKTLDEMGWSGWLVIERSRDAKNARDVKGNFGANARYLKKVFQSE
jgi:sugar phosphate isomerase/epimerase